MIAFLLDKKEEEAEKLKIGASSSKDIGKEEGENFTFKHSDGNENNFGYENLESSSEKSENSEAKGNHGKRMDELEKMA